MLFKTVWGRISYSHGKVVNLAKFTKYWPNFTLFYVPKCVLFVEIGITLLQVGSHLNVLDPILIIFDSLQNGARHSSILPWEGS